MKIRRKLKWIKLRISSSFKVEGKCKFKDPNLYEDLNFVKPTTIKEMSEIE